MRYTFFIAGSPVGKERARTFDVKGQYNKKGNPKHRTITPRDTREFERQVGLHAFAAGMRVPTEYKLWRVVITSYKGTANSELWGTICDETPDGDNVEKATWDGLQPYLSNDKYVGTWGGSKWWCEPAHAGVQVDVCEIDKYGREV